jgi:alpha-ribazole phosphatase/probable phosphoglycerate mutase
VSRLLLVRHGQTEWNLRGLYQGHLDSPLTAEGREQARTVAQRLAAAGAARVVSSDLGRAWDTARIIGGLLELEPIADPDLRELDMGRLAGLTLEQIQARPDYRREPHWRWPSGESFDQLQARVLRSARAWLAEPGASVLVTHAGPIRALLCVTRGLGYLQALSHEVDPTDVLSLQAVDLDSARS